MAKFGDCCIKHSGTNTVGLAMVVRFGSQNMLFLENDLWNIVKDIKVAIHILEFLNKYWSSIKFISRKLPKWGGAVNEMYMI